MDSALRREVTRSLDALGSGGFKPDSAGLFAEWCRQERSRRRDSGAFDLGDIDLLILTEAYIRSVLARTESRAFFFRSDRPDPDPSLDGRHTVARYDPSDDRVSVRLESQGGGLTRDQ
jgi:L-aspartate oxidase